MTFKASGAPLHTLRMRSGLTQREVAEILGLRTDVPVYRHESSRSLPDLRTALGYEIVFKAPLSALFPTLYRSLEPLIEDRIVRLKACIEDKPGKGRNAARDARKLEFFWERENADTD
jgi:transcriptional regulator with XRE-family HTH domain